MLADPKVAADPFLNPFSTALLGLSQLSAGDTAGAGLMRDLDGWIDYEEGAGANLEETLTPEQKERLRSLGYLQ